MATYKFVNDFNLTPKPNNLTTFYQLSSFPNPKHGKYELRRFLVNDENEFVEIKNYLIDKKQYNKFIKYRKRQTYKIYSVYDLTLVSYPTLSDILQSRSDMLSSDYDYYGCAPFLN